MSPFRRLARRVLRSNPRRDSSRHPRSLQCQRLEDRHLLAAEGAVYQFSGQYDAAGLVGNVSAEIRWGDGSTSPASSVSGGGTSNRLNIRFDYSLDTSNFFSGAGQSRRQLLDLAAESIVGRFNDDLTAIVPGGDNQWQPSIYHPSLGPANQVQGNLTNLSPSLSIAANEIVIYVGARDLPGSSLGVGGGGNYSFPSINISCQTQSECDQRVANILAFRDNVGTRGETGARGPVQTDIAPNIGSISFDNQTDWYFGVSATGIQPGQVDFMTVAVHELAHVLGFGLLRSDVTSVWTNLTSSGSFSGPKARAAFVGGGNVPIEAGHWADSVLNQYGQATLMGESIPRGSRQLLSPLDFAAMDDLGWDLINSNATVSASHVFADNGSYPVQVVLRGSRTGEVIHSAGNAVITNVAPTLVASNDLTVAAGQPLQISDIGRISDPGFANSSAIPPTTETFQYSIQWGDGSPLQTGTATIDSQGDASGALTRASFDGTHTYATAGTRTVVLQVTDDDGASDQATFTINVTAPPALVLELDRAVIREDDGDQAATLTVRRSGPVRSTPQTLTLASANPGKIVVPGSAIIPAGSDRISVAVRAIDDALLQGDVSVRLSASGDGVDEDTIDLLVRDHESLTAEFQSNSISESDRTPVSLTVRRSNSDTASPLQVQIQSSDPGETDLPAVITIPANQQQVVIPVLAIDDADAEPTRSIQFTFLAAGYESGTAAIEVADNEPPLFQNSRNPLDVNNSGTITAADALRVINQLALRGGGYHLDPSVDQPGGIFLDTNGDYRVTAVDALLVINHLSRTAQSGGASEQLTEDEWVTITLVDGSVSTQLIKN